jgi:Fur family ferric uptake transcriptional regulator
MVDPRVEEEIRAVKDYFRRVGFRWTKQRQAIVETAFLTHKHFSAEELFDMVRSREDCATVHLATVYRTLQVLEEGRHVEGMDMGKSGRLYEHVLGHEHHDHVICSQCGKIFEFCDDDLEARKAAAAEKLGMRMEAHTLKIYGACRRFEEEGYCPHHDERKSAGLLD